MTTKLVHMLFVAAFCPSASCVQSCMYVYIHVYIYMYPAMPILTPLAGDSWLLGDAHSSPKCSVKACLHYKTVRTRFRWSRFQTVFTRPHWYNNEPVPLTRTRANSLIYHVSLPNNCVIYSGLQLADNGADSICSCVFLSSLFFPRLRHCTTVPNYTIQLALYICFSPNANQHLFVSCALHPAAMVL